MSHGFESHGKGESWKRWVMGNGESWYIRESYFMNYLFCATAHMWMGCGTHMNASCNTHECVMSHIWMPKGHESLTYQSHVMSHMWMSHVTHVNESCHTCEWVMSYIRMSHHDTHMNAQRTLMKLLCKRFMTFGAFMCVTWLIHMCDKSCDTCEWVMSYIRMSHVPHMNESCYTHECVMSHAWMSHVTIWLCHVTCMNGS